MVKTTLKRLNPSTAAPAPDLQQLTGLGLKNWSAGIRACEVESDGNRLTTCRVHEEVAHLPSLAARQVNLHVSIVENVVSMSTSMPAACAQPQSCNRHAYFQGLPLTLAHDEARGRFLVAARDIKSGEVCSMHGRATCLHMLHRLACWCGMIAWHDKQDLRPLITTSDTAQRVDNRAPETSPTFVCHHFPQVVLKCPPYLTALLRSHRKRVCHACLRGSSSGRLTISCSGCGLAHYCSHACREAHAAGAAVALAAGDDAAAAGSSELGSACGVEQWTVVSVPHVAVCGVLRRFSGSFKVGGTVLVASNDFTTYHTSTFQLLT